MRTNNFKLSDIFDIFKGKRLIKEDMVQGPTNFVGAISDNNGVRQKIGQKPLFQPNCITVNYNGSVGEAFYQVEPFWPSDDVNVLYLKNHKLTENIAMYLVTLIKFNKYRFSYGRKWTLDKMNETTIPLPIGEDGSVDWEYMENYIGRLKNKHITSHVTSHYEQLNIEAFKEFMIGDIFEKRRIKKYSSVPELTGKIPFVSSSSTNNGVVAYVDAIPISGNCITVSTNGDCFDCFYQKKDVAVSTDVDVLYNANLNQYNAMFVCVILKLEKNKWSYGRKPKNNKVYETVIKLPEKNGEPDWNFMEQYIKSFKYSDRI